MQGVKLTERINYIHCPGDEDGSHGVLVLLPTKNYSIVYLEVNDQEEFKTAYENLVITEETQNELNASLTQPEFATV